MYVIRMFAIQNLTDIDDVIGIFAYWILIGRCFLASMYHSIHMLECHDDGKRFWCNNLLHNNKQYTQSEPSYNNARIVIVNLWAPLM